MLDEPSAPEPTPAPLPSASSPSPSPRSRRRTTLASTCLVLGLGLLAGAGTATLLGDDPDAPPADVRAYDEARSLWHEVPVDELFPLTLRGDGAGPGGADRVWTRVAVAPDSGCGEALDPQFVKELASVGCHRLIRASYVDETTSTMTTVGLVFTEADTAAMASLRKRFTEGDLRQRTDLLPRPYAERGTPVADFGDAQRASWTTRVLTDAPVIVYAVTGYGDARTVSRPEPAEKALTKGRTSAAAQAGLGHTAKGIADRVERAVRARVAEEAGAE